MNSICVISILVTDMNVAKEFYCNKLGFSISKEFSEDLIRLKHDLLPLLLYKVEEPVTMNYPLQAQVVPGLETDNLLQSISELSAKGVEIIYDSPQKCPAGIYSAFRDPFGNVIELLEFDHT
ncbi:VOC family protein [Paenibacillus sp. HJL G12]|uniref:VOC family protein n=1 Tax=Paenibacillus dendrobii TaxID=2691084 RepID=A0A7X3IFK7_9BACL|nr:VOC family protein [Paenibacillus dendrobii]MWV42989.1 VOC family protein [Paenibacillus dendrobii]